MLSLVLFLLVIISFALFACVRWERKLEEVLPISAMGIILVLFLFGILGILKVGFYFVCIAAIASYVCLCVYVVKQHKTIDFKNAIFNIITPGTIVFAIFTGLIAYWNKGRYAMLTDEFSHWLDTVVIMTRIDDFGTAAGSTAVFPSYPPAMSLLQYLMEKFCLISGEGFVEWKAYYVYQLLEIIVLLPFNKVDKGVIKKISGVLLWIPALIVPLFFFQQAFNSLYIDPFLGILGGCGFAMITLAKTKDWVYHSYIALLCAILTLSKDVGIYLALFIALYYLIDHISRMEQKSNKNVLLAAAPLGAMAIAKMLWKLELTLAHTELKFSAPFDIKGVIATLQGKGSEFYNTVYQNFLNAITYRYIYYERIGLNYTAIMIFLTIAFVLLQVRLYRYRRITKATAVAGAIIPSAAIIFYVLSMFPLYVSRFAEDEARNLASFDRYCGIMFLTGTVLLVFLLRDFILEIKNSWVILVIAIIIVVSVRHSQKSTLDYYFNRQSIIDAENYRSAINILSAQINSKTNEEARILLIGHDEDWPFESILETISKPRSIAFSDRYFSEDAEDTDVTFEELQNIIANEYDYVAIYRTTDLLMNDYAGLFDDLAQVHNVMLFKVDNNKLIEVK